MFRMLCVFGAIIATSPAFALGQAQVKTKTKTQVLAQAQVKTPAQAQACNLSVELTKVGLLTAELHRRVPLAQHNEISDVVAVRLRDVHEADDSGFEAAACDRAQTLRTWVERESRTRALLKR